MAADVGLIPRVLDWVMHLAKLVICIAVILSIPCSPWGPQKLNTIDGGPKSCSSAAAGEKVARSTIEPTSYLILSRCATLSRTPPPRAPVVLPPTSRAPA